MSYSAAEQSFLRLTRAPVLTQPWRHIYVRNVFPDDFYAEMLARLPPDAAYGDEDDYPHRRLLNPMEYSDPFWREIAMWMASKPYITGLYGRFKEVALERFGDKPLDIGVNVRLVRDDPAYSLSPHTDVPGKFLSFLFYLPEDDGMKDFGTTIFYPLDEDRVSDGKAWLPFDEFEPVWTAPYMPNTCFAFARTDRSFHGVLPCPDETRMRNALLLNVYAKVMNADHA